MIGLSRVIDEHGLSLEKLKNKLLKNQVS